MTARSPICNVVAEPNALTVNAFDCNTLNVFELVVISPPSMLRSPSMSKLAPDPSILTVPLTVKVSVNSVLLTLIPTLVSKVETLKSALDCGESEDPPTKNASSKSVSVLLVVELLR